MSDISTGSAGLSPFHQFNLAPHLLSVIDELGYKDPTPIQEKAMPVIVSGRDVVGLAQTGTGKTAAFVLPILNQLWGQPTGTLRALIVVPTRELATQVLEAIQTFIDGTPLRAISIFGGVRIDNHKRQLRQPLDIVVGCPGRLLDLYEQRCLNLSKVQYLVLDEADQMFDMGFIVPIRKILRALPAQRQSLLFSATMPAEIASLTREALRDPVTVQVAPISAPQTLSHTAYPVPAHLKPQLLTHLLGSVSSESVLVFTRTKHKARKLARTLERNGLKVTSLQGNLSQSQRTLAMQGFRSGKYSVMVATDIAARGIDIASISHVINFDFPETTEAYLHRSGRTGRANRLGDAFSFVTPEDEHELRRFERTLRIKFDRKTAEDFDYKAKPVVVLDQGNDGHAPERRYGNGGGNGGGYRGQRSQGGRGGSGGGRFRRSGPSSRGGSGGYARRDSGSSSYGSDNAR